MLLSAASGIATAGAGHHGKLRRHGAPGRRSVQHIRDIKPAARIVADMMEEARSIVGRTLG